MNKIKNKWNHYVEYFLDHCTQNFPYHIAPKLMHKLTFFWSLRPLQLLALFLPLNFGMFSIIYLFGNHKMFFLAWVFINQTISFIVFNFDFGVEVNMVAKMNHKLMVDENVNNKNNIIINYWAKNILLHNVSTLNF